MAKHKKKVLPNNDKSTWENTSMEQISLALGTPEYEEYQRDLKMHDPFRPDDTFHIKLEEHNESVPQILKDRAAKKETVEQRKYSRRIQKEVQFAEAKDAAADKASLTPDKADDKAVERLSLKSLDNIIYNDGITPDEFLPKVLQKY